MRIIDIMLRYALVAYTDDLSDFARMMLLCVASGMSSPEEVSRFCRARFDKCRLVMNKLVARGELKYSEKNGYSLAKAGKFRVLHLMNYSSGKGA